MQVDAAEVGEEPLQDFFAVLNRSQVVVGHDQGVQAGEHGAELADLGPVLEAVVGDVKQAQGGEGHAGGTHSTVLIKAQEQLLQPEGQQHVIIILLFSSIFILLLFIFYDFMMINTYD